MFEIPLNFMDLTPTVGSIASVTSFLSAAPVASVASVVPVVSIAKTVPKVFKSKLTLFFSFVIQFYKLLKLCISLQFEEPKVFSGNSRYIKCIFGYYRSKYLRRVFHPNFRVVGFDLSVHNNFFTIRGGGI